MNKRVDKSNGKDHATNEVSSDEIRENDHRKVMLTVKERQLLTFLSKNYENLEDRL